MPDLTAVTRAAIGAFPGRLRELAKEAGLPYSTIARIRHGALPASPAVARAVAGALSRWGTRCVRAGQELHAVRRRGR